MAVIAITSGAQMTLLVDALANDIIHARFYYDLLLHIAEEFEADPRIYNESAAFWGLSSTALRDATLMRLGRAYDQHRSSLSFINWLETIRANLALFETDAFKERLSRNAFVDSLSELPRMPDAKQLDRDIALVRADDPLIKRLVMLRNNAAAHVSASSVVSGADPFRQHALTLDEFRELLARGKEILNRYSTLFHASSYSDQLVGADDYRFVIGAIRRRLDSDDQAI